MANTKLYLAYAEDYIEQAAACQAKGLLFHDQTLRFKRLTVKELMAAHWPKDIPKPSIAVVYDGETIEVDGERHFIYFYENMVSDLRDMLESGVKTIYCEGYSGVKKKPGSVATRWVNMLIREAAKYDAGIHLMNLQNINPLLDFPIASGDVQFKVLADRRFIFMPNGKRAYEKDFPKFRKWFRGLGISPQEVKSWEDYVTANIKSFTYAINNVKNNPSFQLPTGDYKFTEDGREAHAEAERGSQNHPELMKKMADELVKRDEGQLCDRCTIRNCDQRRRGSVCTKEGSPFVSLAEHFQTRSADVLIEGMTFILADQSNRYQKARAVEDDCDDEHFSLDKDVTQLGSQIMKDGIALMKLVRGDGSVVINLPGGARKNPKIMAALAAANEGGEGN